MTVQPAQENARNEFKLSNLRVFEKSNDLLLIDPNGKVGPILAQSLRKENSYGSSSFKIEVVVSTSLLTGEGIEILKRDLSQKGLTEFSSKSRSHFIAEGSVNAKTLRSLIGQNKIKSIELIP